MISRSNLQRASIWHGIAVCLVLSLSMNFSWAGGSTLVITNGIDVALISVVDELGERPAADAQTLQLTFQRSGTNGVARLPVRYGMNVGTQLSTEVLFADGRILSTVEIPLGVLRTPDLEAERLNVGVLKPESPNLGSAVFFTWGASLDDNLLGRRWISLADRRAPATLDYEGSFAENDPHSAVEVGPVYEERAATVLNEFRKLAGLPSNFAPWLMQSNGLPTFLVAQADGLVAVQTLSFNPTNHIQELRTSRYRSDGAIDPSFAPVMSGPVPDSVEFSSELLDILGQLPDGRILSQVGRRNFSRFPRSSRLVASMGTNVAGGDLLATLEASDPSIERDRRFGPYFRTPVPQFAIIHSDGSLLLEQGVRRRGCANGDNEFPHALPSLNGERLRRTRATIFWKQPPEKTRFAFRQARRSRTARSQSENITVEIRRLGDLSGTRRVFVQTEDGTALGGRDYQPTEAVLEFRPGRVSRSLVIPLLKRDAVVDISSFSLVLSPTAVDPTTTQGMIATPKHQVFLQGNVRLEWVTTERVRVHQPPYQFYVRAFQTLEELKAAEGVDFEPVRFWYEAPQSLWTSVTQFAPAADFYDLDLTTLQAANADSFTGRGKGFLPVKRMPNANTFFLRVDGVDDDTEETDDYCP